MIGACLSLLTALGCGGSSSNQTPAVEMVVGAMLPRTGPNANSDWVSAVELAVVDMKAGLAQAKLAKPISFTVDEQDVASNEQMAHDVMAVYLAEGAKVVITEASNAAIGGNKFNYDLTPPAAKLPLVSFTATSAALNKATSTDPAPERALALQDPENWFFRTCQISDALSAIRLGAVFTRGPNGTVGNGDINGDGVVRVVWIGTDDTSTMASIAGDRTAFTTYVATLPAGSVTFVPETVTFNPGTNPDGFNYNDAIALATDRFLGTDLTTDVGAPDLIINKALPNVAIPFIKAYKQNAANTIPIFQDGSFRRNTLLSSLGAAADGQVGVSNVAYENNPSGLLFKDEQQLSTNFPPAAYEAQGYDAMSLSLLAVIKASADLGGEPALVTPALVRDALEHLNEADGVTIGTGAAEFKKGILALMAGQHINYLGASGGVDFDAVGNVKSRAALWQITGGQFVETQVFDCVASAACPAAPF